MFRKFLAVAATAVAAVAISAGSALASPVPHSINPTIVQTGPADLNLSMAGWYADSFANPFTQVDATFTLNAEAEGIGVSSTPPATPVGAIGAQLCNTTSHGALQVGAIYLGGGLFDVGYSEGALAHGCVGSGALSGTLITGLTDVSVGSAVQTQIKRVDGGYVVSAQVVGGVQSFSVFVPGANLYPNEAGAGLQTDTMTLSAPAVNDLTDFTNVSATDSNGVQAGFANWNAVEVQGSQDGVAPALITPTGLVSNSGPAACHRVKVHHHHRHFTWKTVCNIPTDVSSSFSVNAGTPVGV